MGETTPWETLETFSMLKTHTWGQLLSYTISGQRRWSSLTSRIPLVGSMQHWHPPSGFASSSWPSIQLYFIVSPLQPYRSIFKMQPSAYLRYDVHYQCQQMPEITSTSKSAHTTIPTSKNSQHYRTQGCAPLEQRWLSYWNANYQLSMHGEEPSSCRQAQQTFFRDKR